MKPINARVLWWAMEQQLWALSDLARLAYATELLSGPDHLVLHGLIDQVTYLVRENKEGTDALPKKSPRTVLRPEDGQADYMGPER